MKFVLISLALLLVAGPVFAQIPDLIISEYIEGSAYNKALEIYNGTGTQTNLASYTLEVYSNGSTVPAVISLGSANLAALSVFVIANPSAAQAILDEADLTSSALSFNGNDALVLLMDGQVIDSLGQVGVDPGTGWTCPSGSTYNNTLRRQDGVCAGDEDPSDAFDPCVEFDFFANDSFYGLGFHTDDCQSVLNSRPTWDSLKASFK
jgi:uncharacterized protein